jgi:hypothetical protein
MSRIYLGGSGDSIPLEALPDPTQGDLPALRVVYAEDGSFDKTDFVSLGYTHYEAYAIGAMGGIGGKVGPIVWGFQYQQETIPLNVWNAWKDLRALEGAAPAFVTGRFVPYGSWQAQVWEPLEPGQWMDDGPRMEYLNPSHQERHITWLGPSLGPANLAEGVGGRGGGGGLHLAGGLLADLPTPVPITIGMAGGESPVGQGVSSGPAVPEPPNWQNYLNYMLKGSGVESQFHSDPTGMALIAILNPWFVRWPEPHLSFDPPVAGPDGEPTTFGDIGLASGGKGGGPAILWPGGVKTKASHGGDGGIGGTVVAGGGGAGSILLTQAGSDGTWDGEIGEGGGAGRGGSSTPTVSGTNGGQGSYSFADTTVYGNRGGRDGMIAGGGGGAKVGAYKYGGAAVGWSPNGGVIIRLTAIVP